MILGSYTYTQRYNARHNVRGHLFQGRYKALIMEEGERSYTQGVSDYIHLNPARAGILDLKKQRMKDYRWSSFPYYISTSRRRPNWLTCSRVFGAQNLVDDRAGRLAYARHIEKRARLSMTKKGRDCLNKEWKPIQEGWYLGGDEYKNRLLEKLDKVLLVSNDEESLRGEGVREHGRLVADKLVLAGLKQLGLKEEDLETLLKTDPRKCVLAWNLSVQTQVDQKWIADRLNMGTRGTVANAIYKVKQGGRPEYKKLRSRFSR